MKKQRWYSLLIEAICWAYFILFGYAAFAKLFEYDKFVLTMGQSGMLTPYAGVLAWAVPLVEIVIALMLVFEKSRLLGFYTAFSLMVMFTTYIFIILNYDEKIPCSCGGVLSQMSWTQHLVFNGVFVVLGVVGIVLEKRLRSLSGLRPSLPKGER